MDLPEFLVARYLERETVLRALLEAKIADELPELARGPMVFIEAHDDGLFGQPAAVQELFADIEAKREVVRLLRRYEGAIRQESAVARPGDRLPRNLYAARDALVEAVRLLAQPFADHPAFDPVWR